MRRPLPTPDEGRRRFRFTLYALRRSAIASGPSDWALLAGGVFTVYLRQVLHLLLRDSEVDTVSDLGHRANGDGHLLATPQVALLEKDVSDVVSGGVREDSLDSADFTVGGVDRFTSAHLHLARRD